MNRYEQCRNEKQHGNSTLNICFTGPDNTQSAVDAAIPVEYVPDNSVIYTDDVLKLVRFWEGKIHATIRVNYNEEQQYSVMHPPKIFQRR